MNFVLGGAKHLQKESTTPLLPLYKFVDTVVESRGSAGQALSSWVWRARDCSQGAVVGRF
jgi:hypothetical protein